MGSIDVKNGKIKVDMHIHSAASDGNWKPEVIIEKLLEKNIGIFSITDHDNIENIQILSKICEKKDNLFFIPGLEVSSRFEDKNYHILAYGIDPDNEDLREMISINRDLMTRSDEESMLKYQSKSSKISIEEYLEYEHNSERGGWKSLSYMIDKGLCNNMMEYFDLTDQWGSSYKDIQFYLPHEVCATIIKAGGIPVLAHPGANFYHQDFQYIVGEFTEQGIKGIECFHTSNSQAVKDYCLQFCKQNNLIITGGSDCHGNFIPSRVLGEPEIYLEDLYLGNLNKYFKNGE